ncbi:MAG: EscT/YscT/HrcT family type III secretion system export apparatus protein [Chlamydiota bacterium]
MKFDYLTSDYLNMILQHPYVLEDPSFLPSLFFLALGRMMPLMAFVPFLGSKVLSRPVKVAFGMILVFIFFPYILNKITVPLKFNLHLMMLFMKEVFIGTMIGIMASIPFFIAQTGGIFIDFQRGSASLQVNDPIISTMGSPTGVFFDLFAIYLFFMMGGPFLFISAMIESFQLMPPDVFLSHSSLVQSAPFWDQIIILYNTILVESIKIASPALITILMTDTFLGIANRLAPQVQMVFLGMPLKALFGIGIVWLGWYTITKHIAQMSFSWLDQITLMIHNLSS